MSDLVLKIKNANGDLQRVSSSEENYLAYRPGLQLKASGGTSVGDLKTQSANSSSIGSFTNTFYNEPVGTHPTSSLSIGTTTTNLYAQQGTAHEDGVDNNHRNNW